MTRKVVIVLTGMILPLKLEKKHEILQLDETAQRNIALLLIWTGELIINNQCAAGLNCKHYRLQNVPRATVEQTT